MKKENHDLIAVWKRRTGNLAGMRFQVKPRLGVRMEVEMPELNPAMRYFSRARMGTETSGTCSTLIR
ncbi:MAG: hypothetical protein WBC30_00795 [Candidatus Sulfotelmatobacter sp.]